ncbi:MAG: GAF domain-containing protein [Chloroflexi bacterium]|nr:GAF domain-containing protein [Chloroflexota bacterium]
MNSAEAAVHADKLTARACARFADSLLPALPMDGLAVVLLDPEKETSRVVFSMGGTHQNGSSPGCGSGGAAPVSMGDGPPMCIPLQGREGELGAVLYRGPNAGNYGPDEDALIRRSADRLAEILENIQLRQRLDRMAEESQALDRIGEAVSSGLTLDRVFRRFAHEIKGMLDIHCLRIYVADPCSGRLILACRFGAGARASSLELEPNPDLAEIGLPLRESSLLSPIVQDLLPSTREDLPERQDGPWQLSVIAVPVEFGGAVIGAVVAENRRTGAFGPENHKLLRRAAALLAASIAREALSTPVIPPAVDSEFMNEIARALAASRHLEDVLPALASALGKNLSFDGVTLAWIDPNGWRIHTIHARPGNEEPVAIPAQDFPVAIHTQVLFQGQCIGMMDLWRREGEAFAPREQEFLDYLGLQMAPLVQNARLRELAQRQAYRLTQLKQTECSLSPFRDLDTVVREAVEEAARLGDALWAELYLYQEQTLSFHRAAATGVDDGGPPETANQQTASLVESCFHSGGARVLRGTPGIWGVGNRKRGIGEAADGDTHNILGLPLQTVEGTTGVLVLGGRLGQDWSEAEVILLEVFAGNVAEAIGEARYAQEQGWDGSRKRLESLRRDLLTDVAGSIRQPLTSIKGYADSLVHSEVAWPEELRREFLETIGQQADRLDRVVSDLLIPTRWESGAVMLDEAVFTVKGLLDHVAVELEKEPLRCPVMFRCEPTLSPVLVDPQRMVQVILWLLQAADERLGPDKTLRVEGDWDDGRPRITVGVDVEGSPDNKRGLVSTSGSNGAGNLRDDWQEDDLRLVACRHILEGHGVTLQVAASPDARELFRFTLPLAPN